MLPFFENELPAAVEPDKQAITIGHLLSMQSGLERTSGRNYGAWVSSRDWVADAIRRPLVAAPGGRMLYEHRQLLGHAGRYAMFYGWGYGGQFVFVVPDLELMVVATSDPEQPRGGGHLRQVHAILDRWIVPAAEVGEGRGR